MLQNIKMLIGESANGKDNVLTYLIESAKSFAVSYCRLEYYKTVLDNIVVKMVIEDFNRLGGQGLSIQSFSGMSEHYNQDYSETIYKALNKFRKIKTL